MVRYLLTLPIKCVNFGQILKERAHYEKTQCRYAANYGAGYFCRNSLALRCRHYRGDDRMTLTTAICIFVIAAVAIIAAAAIVLKLFDYLWGKLWR